jgi:hypothetical protein
VPWRSVEHAGNGKGVDASGSTTGRLATHPQQAYPDTVGSDVVAFTQELRGN